MTRLRDLDDELGAAFRSAEHDGPRSEAKAALMAALGVGVATVASASGAAASTTVATTVAAGGSSAAAAKTAGTALVAKWVIASAVVVSGAAATVHVVTHSSDAGRESVPADVASAQAAARPAMPSLTAVHPLPAPAAEPEPASPDEPAIAVAVAVETRPVAPPAPRTPGAPLSPPVEPQVAPFAVTPAVEPPVAPVAPVAVPAVVEPPSATVVTKARPADDGPRRGTVGDEIAQLDRARALLKAGRGADALDAIRVYRRTFPVGVLSEEASVLEIESLAVAGERDRARSLGDRFLETQPRSPLVPRVMRATGRGGSSAAP